MRYGQIAKSIFAVCFERRFFHSGINQVSANPLCRSYMILIFISIFLYLTSEIPYVNLTVIRYNNFLNRFYSDVSKVTAFCYGNCCKTVCSLANKCFFLPVCCLVIFYTVNSVFFTTVDFHRHFGRSICRPFDYRIGCGILCGITIYLCPVVSTLC